MKKLNNLVLKQNMSQRTQLLAKLNMTNCPTVSVAVQPIANSAQNLKDGCGLTNHIDAFKTRINKLKGNDIMCLTELNRQLSDEQKRQIEECMSDAGYILAGTFTKNNKDEWSMASAMYYKSTLELAEVHTPVCSHSDPNEFRKYPLTNGAILATFIKDGFTYKIGFIHSSLLRHLEQKYMYDIIFDEWNAIKSFIDEGYSMFGNFTVSSGCLYLAEATPAFAEVLASLPFHGLHTIDFICGNADYVPKCVSAFTGGIIEESESGDRIIDTLVKAIGNKIIPIAMYHPVTFKNIIHLTPDEITEMTIGLNFNTGCFDHCAGTYAVQPQIDFTRIF